MSEIELLQIICTNNNVGHLYIYYTWKTYKPYIQGTFSNAV